MSGMSDNVKGCLVLAAIVLVFASVVAVIVVTFQGNEKEVCTITIERVEYIPPSFGKWRKTVIYGEEGSCTMWGHPKFIPAPGTKVRIYEDTWNKRSRLEVVK